MIFVGIEGLKVGMDELAMHIKPESFPGLTWLDVPLLLTIGIVMTVVMQSSSAAVATTLAALHSGAISLDQAAVLVIGQNIGTTVTALLGSIGVSISARRTAMDIAVVMVGAIRDRLRGHARRLAIQARLETAREAVSETQGILGKVSAESGREVVFVRHLATIHALEHLNRLAEVGSEKQRLTTIGGDPELQATARSVLELIELALPMLVTESPSSHSSEPTTLSDDELSRRMDELAAASTALAQRRREKRAELLERCAVGQLRSTDAMVRIDIYLWLDQIGDHIWRTAVHLRKTPMADRVAENGTAEPSAGS